MINAVFKEQYIPILSITWGNFKDLLRSIKIRDILAKGGDKMDNKMENV